MHIPHGDLAPARRRQFGGSYGRRRRRNQRRALAAVVLLLAVGGGAFLLQRDDAQAPARVAQQQPTPQPRASACPRPAPVAAAPALPQPQQVRLRLLNGTSRNGLAKTIGDQLAARGFMVTEQANAPAALAGASRVAYAAGAAPAATVTSHWVVGAQVVLDPTVPRGTVQVTLGSGFRRLASPAEAARLATVPAVATPTASACAS